MDVIYPKPWLLFGLFVICGHLYLDYSLYRRWKGWARGMKMGFAIRRLKGPVMKIWLYEVFLQRQLLSLSVMRWMIHLCIFWGFISLTFLSLAKFILLLLSMIALDAGLHDFFSNGAGYSFTKIWGDFFGLLLLAGCTGALARRFVFRPVQTAHDQTDIFLSVYLLFMTVSGFMLEGMRMSASPSDLDRYAFIGRLFMPSHFGVVSVPGTWLAWTWIVHAFSGAAILVYLPHSKLLHSLLAPLVIALNASEEQGRKDMYWPKTDQYRPTK
jgi:heterodisulfide reductase subunit E